MTHVDSQEFSAVGDNKVSYRIGSAWVWLISPVGTPLLSSVNTTELNNTDTVR